MTHPVRKPGWEKRFVEAVKSYEGKPFVWGETDCGCFAADCVVAISGVDFMAPIRGRYRGRIGLALRTRCSTTEAALVKLLEPLGAIEIEPDFAAVGDLGISACDAVVIRAPGGFIARTVDGSITPMDAKRAWILCRQS